MGTRVRHGVHSRRAGHYTWQSAATQFTHAARPHSRIVAEWGLWKGRESGRLPARPTDQPQQQRAAGLLLRAGVVIIIITDSVRINSKNCKDHWRLASAGDIDRQLRAPYAASAGAQQQMRVASC